MNPLVISAVSSIASNVIDGITHSGERKAAELKENFAALLAKTAKTPSAKSMRTEQINGLHQRLMDCPEVHTLIDTADPSKPPTITLSADGTITATSADGRSRQLQLSPESKAVARQLAAHIPANSTESLQLTSTVFRNPQPDVRQILPSPLGVAKL